MNVIEALILYVVLFLRGAAVQSSAGELIDFSAVTELARIVLYNIPSLALVWYLLLKVKRPRAWGVGWPSAKDIVPGLLSLGGLALTGFAVSLAAPLFSEIPAGPKFLPPENAVSWIILVLSCLSTGYLEESFFRFYLLAKRGNADTGPLRAVLVSILFFSFCHVYEGPWGFLNAVLSGGLLSFVFLRSGSLHGIALAQGLYNILVYALAAL